MGIRDRSAHPGPMRQGGNVHRDRPSSVHPPKPSSRGRDPSPKKDFFGKDFLGTHHQSRGWDPSSIKDVDRRRPLHRADHEHVHASLDWDAKRQRPLDDAEKASSGGKRPLRRVSAEMLPLPSSVDPIQPSSKKPDPFRGKRQHYNNSARKEKAAVSHRNMKSGTLAQNACSTKRIDSLIDAEACCCTKQCFKKIDRNETMKFMRNFWGLPKLEQDRVVPHPRTLSPIFFMIVSSLRK